MPASFPVIVSTASFLVIGLVCAFAMAGAFTSQMNRKKTKTKKGEYTATAVLIGFKSMLMFVGGLFIGAFGVLSLFGAGTASPSEVTLGALVSATVLFVPILVSASVLSAWTHGKEFPPGEAANPSAPEDSCSADGDGIISGEGAAEEHVETAE